MRDVLTKWTPRKYISNIKPRHTFVYYYPRVAKFLEISQIYITYKFAQSGCEILVPKDCKQLAPHREPPETAN